MVATGYGKTPQASNESPPHSPKTARGGKGAERHNDGKDFRVVMSPARRPGRSADTNAIDDGSDHRHLGKGLHGQQLPGNSGPAQRSHLHKKHTRKNKKSQTYWLISAKNIDKIEKIWYDEKVTKFWKPRDFLRKTKESRGFFIAKSFPPPALW